MYIIYGIKNCDTMKKAFRWLNEHHITYQFHNYKTDGLTESLLNHLLEIVNYYDLINKKGLTWRKLSDLERESIKDEKDAKKIILMNPSIIKRPLLVHGKQALLGFSDDSYQNFTNKTVNT